jgi:hypothetical protein
MWMLNKKGCLQRMWNLQLVGLDLYFIRNKIVKGPMLHQMSSLVFICCINPFAKDHGTKKCFMENVMLYLVKG